MSVAYCNLCSKSRIHPVVLSVIMDNNPTPIPQDTVFYKDPWSRTRETLVLMKLYQALHEQRWIRGNSLVNKVCVDEVHDAMSGHPYYIDIPRRNYHYKVAEWKRRHFYFYFLKQDERVWYDDTTNTVYASAATWAAIHEVWLKLVCKH